MKHATLSDSSRLFIALWPDQITREALQTCREHWTWPKHAHLAHTNSLHVTLHFLGDVAQSKIPALIDTLRLPFTAFDLTLSQQQVWTNGIAVLEPEATPPQLLQLHRELSSALQSLAIPVETRRYRPHVTFARRANDAIFPETCQTIQWRVQGYALMQSQLTPPGGYKILQSYC